MNNKLFERRTDKMRSSRQVVENAISRSKGERQVTWEIAARHLRQSGSEWPDPPEFSDDHTKKDGPAKSQTRNSK